MSKKPYRLVEQEVAQLEERIRKHRLKILKLIILFVILAIIAAGILYYVYETKSYTEYQVIESVERQDSAGTQFAQMNGNIIKYI